MEQAPQFIDGAAYERLMAPWSRAAGAVFLDWIAPTKGARWIDIGCGTGVFTELVLETCAPATMVAIDPAEAQIQIARAKPVARKADFRVVDAQTLPFQDGAFDVVASALVINFIPDRPRAIAEMRRVARPGGVVAGYVWDFAGARYPMMPIRRVLEGIGVKAPVVAGTEDSRLEALSALFAGSGLKDVSSRAIDVKVSYPNFDDCWLSLTPSFHPFGKIISAMSEPDRKKVRDAVQAGLPASRDGSITYSARANAVKARVPEKIGSESFL